MKTLVKNIETTFGEKGSLWIKSLTNIIEELKCLWDFNLIKVLDNLSFNYVALVQSNTYGKSLLKISFKEEVENREFLATEKFRGSRLRSIYNYSSEYNSLLMEFIEPGFTLRSIESRVGRTSSAIELLESLQYPLRGETKGFPNYRYLLEKAIDYSIGKGLGGGGYPDFSNEALSKYNRIDNGEYYLTHGDFHHDNILLQGNTWKAIDPKGVIAPKYMDLGRFIINEEWRFSSNQSVSGCIDILSDLTGLSQGIIKDMAYIETLLAYSWWFQGDLSSDEYRIKICEMERSLAKYE